MRGIAAICLLVPALACSSKTTETTAAPASPTPIVAEAPPERRSPATPKPAEPEDGERRIKATLDCIHDPEIPGCIVGSDPDLGPQKRPTREQIEEGAKRIRPRLQRCREEHGAPSGTTVAVRFTVKGVTGSVTDASVQAPHSGTPFGDCVESVANNTSFAQFTDPKFTFGYEFRL